MTTPETKTPVHSSELVMRLRGTYTIPVNDGAGLLDGRDTFTRQFQTPPIQHAAADRIEQLETAIAWALMHLDSNIDVDGNSMKESDAARTLREAHNDKTERQARACGGQKHG